MRVSHHSIPVMKGLKMIHASFSLMTSRPARLKISERAGAVSQRRKILNFHKKSTLIHPEKNPYTYQKMATSLPTQKVSIPCSPAFMLSSIRRPVIFITLCILLPTARRHHGPREVPAKHHPVMPSSQPESNPPAVGASTRRRAYGTSILIGMK